MASPAYYRGFRVGLGTTDEPVSNKMGAPLATISAIEQFVTEEGPDWANGFWNGIAKQPEFHAAIQEAKRS